MGSDQCLCALGLGYQKLSSTCGHSGCNGSETRPATALAHCCGCLLGRNSTNISDALVAS
eukprot:5074166-Amphidinium_carterae.1